MKSGCEEAPQVVPACKEVFYTGMFDKMYNKTEEYFTREIWMLADCC